MTHLPLSATVGVVNPICTELTAIDCKDKAEEFSIPHVQLPWKILFKMC